MNFFFLFMRLLQHRSAQLRPRAGEAPLWVRGKTIVPFNEQFPFPISRRPGWPPKGMAIRGHVSGRGPAPLGRMSEAKLPWHMAPERGQMAPERRYMVSRARIRTTLNKTRLPGRCKQSHPAKTPAQTQRLRNHQATKRKAALT